MKKNFFAFLFLIPFICSFNLWADRAGYTITNYQFDGIYNANNTVTVKETIEVNFDEPRHGIYHTIPEFTHINVTQDENNPLVKKYITKIENISVFGDKCEISSENDNCVFKVGRADVEISGPKTYEFNYTYVFPDDRFDEADFIYYSVLGTEWETNIQHFAFNFSFENGIPDQIDIFSGAYGNEGDALNVPVSIKGNTLHGELDNIGPENGITIYSVVPEGYFSNELVSVNSVYVWIGYIIALLISIYILYLCFSYHQKNPVKTVEFYPPEGIPSAEVGVIIDNSVDNIDLISLIPWFAHKGYLKIAETKTGKESRIILTKIKDLPSNAPAYQKQLFSALFQSNSKEINLNLLPGNFSDKFNEAHKALENELKDNKQLYKNKYSCLFLAFISCFTTGLALLFDSPVCYFDNVYSILISGIFLLMAFLKNSSVYRRFMKPKKFKFLLIVEAVISVFIILFHWDEAYYQYTEFLLPWWASTLLYILNALVCLLNHRTLRPSDWNIEMTGKLMGLKEFIRTAEVPRIKALVDENPEYFYDVLPYAMVFDLSDKWGDLFKDIDMEQPEWYQSDNFHKFNALSFTYSVEKEITSCISSSVSTSTSSSSSGGFSGGGGGGGGGGSW